MNKLFFADFETNNNENDCHVWSYGIAEINKPCTYKDGDSLEEFINLISEGCNKTIYFHNAKFDTSFIIDYLLRQEYHFVLPSRRLKLEEKQFSMVLNEKNVFYTMTIHFPKNKTNKKGCIVKIIDSYKLIPQKLEKIAKEYNLNVLKGEIDYDLNRPVGYLRTAEEKEYQKNDVLIGCEVMEIFFNEGLNKMTIGSNAINIYKEMLIESYRKEKNIKEDVKIDKRSYFESIFPVLPYALDKVLRKAYKGGFVYVKEDIQGKIVGKGKVFDVNSLYPYIMYSKFLPYGSPIYVPCNSDTYVRDELYPLEILHITCSFVIKENHLPTIQLKNTLGFLPNEYLKSSTDVGGRFKEVDIILTNVDFELMKEHYNIYNLNIVEYWKFKGKYNMFKDYIDRFMKQKIENKKLGNPSKTEIAKLLLNNLYGKFGTNPETSYKIPYIDKKTDTVKYKDSEKEVNDAVYIPMACFITAYAREHTIRESQKIYDRFLYSDTDSIHCLGDDIPEGMEVDKTKLGAWDNELNFIKAKYLRQKCYIELGKKPHDANKVDLNKYEMKVTCSGLPSELSKQVTFDNFVIGAEYYGKKIQKRCKGGLVLYDGYFTIRKNSLF